MYIYIITLDYIYIHIPTSLTMVNTIRFLLPPCEQNNTKTGCAHRPIHARMAGQTPSALQPQMESSSRQLQKSSDIWKISEIWIVYIYICILDVFTHCIYIYVYNKYLIVFGYIWMLFWDIT